MHIESNVSEEAVLKRSIDIHGHNIKSMIAMEECGELIQAISKANRDMIDTDKISEKHMYNLVEEMADVMLVIKQLQLMYGISDFQIESYAKGKIQRQLLRDSNLVNNPATE